MKLQERLCRRTALHCASMKGCTEMAIALVEAGADVDLKSADGCGSSGCILVSLVRRGAGAAGPSSRVGAAGVAASAVQVDGAALGVAGRPHGDGDGACQGGRGCELQGRRRVRFSRLHARVVGSLQCGGGRSVDSGLELQEWLFLLCRLTALHFASYNGFIKSAVALLVGGADQTITTVQG